MILRIFRDSLSSNTPLLTKKLQYMYFKAQVNSAKGIGVIKSGIFQLHYSFVVQLFSENLSLNLIF